MKKEKRTLQMKASYNEGGYFHQEFIVKYQEELTYYMNIVHAVVDPELQEAGKNYNILFENNDRFYAKFGEYRAMFSTEKIEQEHIFYPKLPERPLPGCSQKELENYAETTLKRVKERISIIGKWIKKCRAMAVSTEKEITIEV
jgi:hypothetical protein